MSYFLFVHVFFKVFSKTFGGVRHTNCDISRASIGHNNGPQPNHNNKAKTHTSQRSEHVDKEKTWQ